MKPKLARMVTIFFRRGSLQRPEKTSGNPQRLMQLILSTASSRASSSSVWRTFCRQATALALIRQPMRRQAIRTGTTRRIGASMRYCRRSTRSPTADRSGSWPHKSFRTLEYRNCSCRWAWNCKLLALEGYFQISCNETKHLVKLKSLCSSSFQCFLIRIRSFDPIQLWGSGSGSRKAKTSRNVFLYKLNYLGLDTDPDKDPDLKSLDPDSGLVSMDPKHWGLLVIRIYSFYCSVRCL